MSEKLSTMMFDGKIHIEIPKAVRHDRKWIAAQREAKRQRRMTQALVDRAVERGQPIPRVME